MKVFRLSFVAVLAAGVVGLGYGAVAGGAETDEAPVVAPQPEYSGDWSDARGPVSEGPVTRRGKLAVQLVARPAVVDQGGNVGVEVRNRGKAWIGYGYGENLQRREGGRWVRAWDAYHPRFMAWIMPLLGVRPGSSAGPDQGWNGPIQVVLNPKAKPGLYRIVKHVLPLRGGQWRDDQIWVTVKFRVEASPDRPPAIRQLHSRVGVRRTGETAARLWLDRNEVKAGEDLSLTVENLGSTTVAFDEGARISGWVEGSWKSPGSRSGWWDEDDIRVEPDLNLRVKAGSYGGPGYGGTIDRVRVPKRLKPGLYSVTKSLVANPGNENRSSGVEVAAWFRVVE